MKWGKPPGKDGSTAAWVERIHLHLFGVEVWVLCPMSERWFASCPIWSLVLRAFVRSRVVLPHNMVITCLGMCFSSRLSGRRGSQQILRISMRVCVLSSQSGLQCSYCLKVWDTWPPHFHFRDSMWPGQLHGSLLSSRNASDWFYVTLRSQSWPTVSAHSQRCG